ATGYASKRQGAETTHAGVTSAAPGMRAAAHDRAGSAGDVMNRRDRVFIPLIALPARCSSGSHITAGTIPYSLPGFANHAGELAVSTSAKRCVAVAFLLGIPLTVCADDWPQFRGPGAAALSKESKLPTEWGKDKNIAWKVEIPGVAWSSPIVIGDKVIVTTA